MGCGASGAGESIGPADSPLAKLEEKLDLDKKRERSASPSEEPRPLTAALRPSTAAISLRSPTVKSHSEKALKNIKPICNELGTLSPFPINHLNSPSPKHRKGSLPPLVTRAPVMGMVLLDQEGNEDGRPQALHQLIVRDIHVDDKIEQASQEEAEELAAPREQYQGPYIVDVTSDAMLNVRLMSGEKVFSQRFILKRALFPQAVSVDIAVMKELRRKIYKKELDRPLIFVADAVTLEGQVLLEHVYLPMLEEEWAPSANITVVVLCPTHQTPPSRAGLAMHFVGALHSLGYCLAGSLLPSRHAAGMSLAGCALAHAKVALMPRHAFDSVEDMCRPWTQALHVVQSCLESSQFAVSPDGAPEMFKSWIRDCWGTIRKDKAWLWRYYEEGMEKEDCSEAVANLEALWASQWASGGELSLPPTKSQGVPEPSANGEILIVPCGDKSHRVVEAMRRTLTQDGAMSSGTLSVLPDLDCLPPVDKPVLDRVIFLVVEAAAEGIVSRLEHCMRAQRIVVTDTVLCAVLLPARGNEASEARAAVYLAWDAQHANLSILVQDSVERVSRVLCGVVAGPTCLRDLVAHMCPYRRRHFAFVYEQDTKLGALTDEGCVHNEALQLKHSQREGLEDCPEFLTLFAISSGADAASRLNEHLRRAARNESFHRGMCLEGRVFPAAGSAVDESDALLFSWVMLVVRPSAIDELLERMICVAETVVEEMEESGQDAGAFEDASEELQLLRREYQGSGRAIGFGEESDNSG